MKKKTKRSYAAGGTISQQVNLEALSSLMNNANYQFDPNGQPYQANLGSGAVKGASAGAKLGPWGAAAGAAVGLGSELIKQYQDKKQRASYVASATPGNYAVGGAIGSLPAYRSSARSKRGSKNNLGLPIAGAVGAAGALALLAARNKGVSQTTSNQTYGQLVPQGQGVGNIMEETQPWTVVHDPQKQYGAEQYAASGGKLKYQQGGPITNTKARRTRYVDGMTNADQTVYNSTAALPNNFDFLPVALPQLINQIPYPNITTEMSGGSSKSKSKNKFREMATGGPTDPFWPFPAPYPVNNESISVNSKESSRWEPGLKQLEQYKTGVKEIAAQLDKALLGNETKEQYQERIRRVPVAPKNGDGAVERFFQDLSKRFGTFNPPADKYANGGALRNVSLGQMGDQQLSSQSFQVKGNPNITDGNSYPELNANLDHNEVVKMEEKQAPFVFSNKLKMPNGKSFAEAARKLEVSTGKSEKVLKSNPNDPFARATIAHNENRSNILAQAQEELATAKGLRDTRTMNAATGGSLGGPDPATLVNLSELKPGFSGLFYDPINDKYVQQIAGTTSFKDYDRQLAEGMLGRATLAKVYAASQNILADTNAVRRNPYELTTTSATPRMSDVPSASNESYVPRQFTAQDNQRTGRTYPSDPLSALPRTYDNGGLYQLTTTDDIARLGGRNTPPIPAGQQPSVAGGNQSVASSDRPDIYGNNVSTSVPTPEDTPRDSGIPSPRGNNRRSTTSRETTNASTTSTVPPRYDQDLYEMMKMDANAGNLPVARGAYDAGLAEQGVVTAPVTSTAPARALPNIATAADFGKNTADAGLPPINTQFTVGDGLQLLEVGSKFAQSIGGPEKEKPYYDNTSITKENFDPSNALYQSQRNFQLGQNTLQNSSINQNRSFLNNLYVGKLNQDSDILAKYNQMNQGARTQQEQRQADQRRYNIGQTVGTNDINARNRGAYKNALDTAFTSLGNFGEGLNAKQQGTDVLNILRSTYPEVYARIMQEKRNGSK